MSAATAAGAVLLAALNHVLLDALAGVVAALSFATVGAVVSTHGSKNRIAWIFIVIGISGGLTAFADQYARYALMTAPRSLPAGPEMAWVASWLWFPGLALIPTLLPLLFPDGRLISRRWRPVAWLTVTLITIFVAAAAVVSWPLRGARLLGAEEIGSDSVNTVMGVVFMTVFLVLAPASIVSMVLRFTRARGIARQQMKWFAYASVLTIALLLLSFLVPGSPWTEVIFVIAAPLLPIAASIAILKHHLYDIDVVINRSLVYGTLTASLVGTYVAIVSVLGQLLRFTGYGISLVAAGVVAVMFAPLRERLQRAINQLMYGERDDPYEVITRLGHKLEASLSVEEILPSVTEIVAHALRVPYVAMELRTDQGFATVTSFGSPAGELVRLPLAYQGETIGELLVSQRAVGEPFSAADHRLLEDLSRQAGSAAHAVVLTADLQRSRQRLVTAREEERRRLRRDLHDGLGPSLAGVAMEIQAARNLINTDAAAADALLAKLGAETQAAIADIRRLVYGLRPPALDELGLIHALEEQAARFHSRGSVAVTDSGLQVSIVASGDLQTLPAAVEVAAYRIALEAITNAARHSEANICIVRLGRNGSLELDISDDGNGFPSHHRAGVGLTAMRERAAELGGDLTIDSASGSGTRVHARLPLDVNQ